MFSIRHPVVIACAVACFGLGLLVPVTQSFAAQGLPETVVPARSVKPGDLDAWHAYNRVLDALQTRFYGNAPSEMRLTYGAIRGLLRPLDDPFTRFMDPAEYKSQKDETVGDFVGIGVYLSPKPTRSGYYAVERTLPGGPAASAGLRQGDVILTVDGRSVKGAKLDQVSKVIRGKPGTSVRLTVYRVAVKRPVTLRIARKTVEYEVVEHGMKPGKIGYVRLSLFNAHADEQVRNAIRALDQQGMKGLILDLRDNPGGMLESAIDLASRFVPPGNDAVVIVEAGGHREGASVNASKYLHLKVPLVVLIDGDSASASEILAGAIKDNHAGTLIGETTYGKGLVQTVIELPYGSAVAITSAKYLTSKGNDINRARGRRGGVDPDIRVARTEKDIFLGKDPQMDRALDLLRAQTSARR